MFLLLGSGIKSHDTWYGKHGEADRRYGLGKL